MEEFTPAWLPLDKVLMNQEVMNLQWKHSVFTARILDPKNEVPLLEEIESLAAAATKALGIMFCCVDIVKDSDGNLKVLEVNSSVWVEDHEIGPENVKKIYKAAMALMLGLDSKVSPSEEKKGS
jgi:hypothetical protein